MTAGPRLRGAITPGREGTDGQSDTDCCDRRPMTVSPMLLPLDVLGARESAGTVTFGLWLPWVSAADGNSVSVKVIHERDQFLQDIPCSEFAMSHGIRAAHGDFWSVTVPIAGTPPPTPRSAWGSPGRYVFATRSTTRTSARSTGSSIRSRREFGVGRMSAFTLGYQPYAWSAAEAGWRTPALADLIVYEVNIAELGGDLDRASEFLAYLADLGVNAIEVMPLSNAGASVDWGYLPIGYFGVDERFGKRSDFQALVDVAHQHGIAVIVDVVYGHTGVGFPYYDAYTRLRYHENPFMGPFAKDYFSNFGKSTDFGRPLTRDYFFSVNHHWLEVYHVDGFRYDCVPNYWDGPLGVGYASLVHDTYQLAKANLAGPPSHWSRFDGGAGRAVAIDPVRRATRRPRRDPADDVLQLHLAERHVRRGTVGGARRPRPAYRLGLASWPCRLSRASRQQRRRHSQVCLAVSGEPRPRAIHLQLRAKQSGRGGQPALPGR